MLSRKLYVSEPLKQAQKRDATAEAQHIGWERSYALSHSLLPTMFLRRRALPRPFSASTADVASQGQVRPLQRGAYPAHQASTELTWALQLLKKEDKVVFCPLPKTQLDVYKRLLALPEVQLIVTHDEPCPCGNVDDEGCVPHSLPCSFCADRFVCSRRVPLEKGKCCNPEWSKNLLSFINLFQKVSNHVALIYPGTFFPDPGLD